MIGYYNYSVVLTYAGLVSAMIGIVRALDGNPRVAVLCLMISGVCDMFDGTIARKCKRSEDEKMFGVQIDSLCDLVCFGVLPAMIGYSVGGGTIFSTCCMAFYVLTAVIRLGYFNVNEMNRMKSEDAQRAYYEGLPVTSAALLVPVLMLLDLLIKGSTVRFYNIALLVIGALFISKAKIRKPYIKGLTVIALLGMIIFLLVYRYLG